MAPLQGCRSGPERATLLKQSAASGIIPASIIQALDSQFTEVSDKPSPIIEGVASWKVDDDSYLAHFKSYAVNAISEMNSDSLPVNVHCRNSVSIFNEPTPVIVITSLRDHPLCGDVCGMKKGGEVPFVIAPHAREDIGYLENLEVQWGDQIKIHIAGFALTLNLNLPARKMGDSGRVLLYEGKSSTHN